jgi:hypothetical protein
MFVPPQQLAQHQHQQQQQQQWSSHYRQPHVSATRPTRAPMPSHYSPPRHHHQEQGHSAYSAYPAPFKFYSPSHSPTREGSPVSVHGQFVPAASQLTGAKDGSWEGSRESREGSSCDGSREPSPDGSSYVSNGTVYFPPPEAEMEAPFAATAARGRKGGGALYAGQAERRAVTHSGQRVMLLSTAVNVEHAASLVRVTA